MTTSTDVKLQVDTLGSEAAVLGEVSQLEQKGLTTVLLEGSVENWPRVRVSLLALRAANITPILQLHRGDVDLRDEEFKYLFAFLRDWDQCLLINVLQLCREWFPEQVVPLLETEARTELKWFREWATAAADPRLHKYPALPWRSFMRRISGENHAFAEKLMELSNRPNTPENQKELELLLRSFLELKRQVVCIFPKRRPKKTEV